MSLRSLRIRAGLSQRALAAKAGVHWTTVTDIETKRTTRPHPRIRYALAAALGVDMAAVTEFSHDIRNGDSDTPD
jgi:transcriptional regulator with XRE-family HTH domain